jgi:hypothetical protein
MRSLASSALEAALDIGSPLFEFAAALYLVSAHIEAGDYAQAVQLIEHYESETEGTGRGGSLPTAVLCAVASASLGNLEAARALRADFERAEREDGAPVTPLWRMRIAQVDTLLDAAPEDDADLAQLENQCRETAFHAFVPHVHLERARRARRRGDADAEAIALGVARALFGELGAPAWIERIDSEFGAD